MSDAANHLVRFANDTLPAKPPLCVGRSGRNSYILILCAGAHRFFSTLTVAPGCFQRLAQQLVQVSTHRKKRPKTLNQTHGISLVTGLFTTGASGFYFWTFLIYSPRFFSPVFILVYQTEARRTQELNQSNSGTRVAPEYATQERNEQHKRKYLTVVRKPSAYARSLNSHQN